MYAQPCGKLATQEPYPRRASPHIVGGHELEGTLNDSETALEIGKQLPVEIRMSRWGDEYYGGIDGVAVSMAPDARAEMAIGELAFWPPGNAFCILFGPTPASHGSEPRLASEGNPFGQLEGDVATVLGGLGQSVKVRIEAI